MKTQEIILELRTKHGLSQDELAEKVFVTRQAVSRWETGETVPNTETLKLLSKLFDVSINALLGEPRPRICQCCGMPLEDGILGRNQDGTPNEEYCQWCYADGTYTYSDMDELIEVCIPHMASAGFSETQAREYMRAALPKLDYWKHFEERGGQGSMEALKKQLMEEINALNIAGMPKLERLNARWAATSIWPIRFPAASASNFWTTVRPISATNWNPRQAQTAASACWPTRSSFWSAPIAPKAPTRSCWSTRNDNRADCPEKRAGDGSFFLTFVIYSIIIEFDDKRI